MGAEVSKVQRSTGRCMARSALPEGVGSWEETDAERTVMNKEMGDSRIRAAMREKKVDEAELGFYRHFATN